MSEIIHLILTYYLNKTYENKKLLIEKMSISARGVLFTQRYNNTTLSNGEERDNGETAGNN